MTHSRPDHRPRLLDLFCGAGGAALGYHRAGFEVVGVDIDPQPEYPFEFHQGDALTYPLDGFAAIHASPPCEAYTHARRLHAEGPDYPDLLGPTRDRLSALNVPWVLENVPGSPIRAQLLLCGTMFELIVHRHRYFELNWSAPLAPFQCTKTQVRKGEAISYFGGKTHGRQRLGYRNETIWANAAGLEHIKSRKCRKAIPPAYTEWLGRQLMEVLA